MLAITGRLGHLTGEIMRFRRVLDGLFSVAPKTDRVCCLGLISADQPEEPRHGQETRWTDQRDQRCSDVALAVDPSPHLSALEF